MGTIVNRGYVYKKGSALVPAWLAFSVVRLLEDHFPRQISYEFTARWRTSSTTSPAAGATARPSWPSSTSAPAARSGLKTLVNELGDIDAKELATFPIGDRGIDLRVGRYGPYVEGPGPTTATPRRPGQRPRRPAARRADAGQGSRAARQPVR